MPRSKTDNQEIRAARRSAILAAAAQVFAEKGIARTKVTDIAAAANLSHGLLYHYFPSKEAVFEAIVDEMMTRTERDLDAPQPRAIDRLRYMMTRAQARVAEDALSARIVTHALLMREHVSDELHARLAAHLERALHRTRETIAQAQVEGDLDDSVAADELSRMFLFLFRGMAISMPGFEIPLPRPGILLDLLSSRVASAPRPRRGTGKKCAS